MSERDSLRPLRTRAAPSFDLAIVADFTSLDEVRAYRAHPAHVEMAAFMDTLIEHIHSVDFEMQTPLA